MQMLVRMLVIGSWHHSPPAERCGAEPLTTNHTRQQKSPKRHGVQHATDARDWSHISCLLTQVLDPVALGNPNMLPLVFGIILTSL
jgi:hypothetical protein